MKKLLAFIIAALVTTGAFSQAPAPSPTFIKGDLNIRYNTRTQRDGDKPKASIEDAYVFKLNVSNSAIFDGKIMHRPFIRNAITSNQTAQLTVDIGFLVVNPRNPAQSVPVGKLYGVVPIDERNVYRFTDGDVRVSINGMGGAKSFESKFNGLALGKPPAGSEGMVARIKREAQKITRNVNGKPVTISVAKYDTMEFQAHVLAAGPVQIYPETTVNGTLLYDYGRGAWYFQGVTVNYAQDGQQRQDVLSGNIRWVESVNRKANGEGEYVFDIRVNEPPVTEAALFSGPADESAFFAVDTSIASLTGAMKYKDAILNDTVTQSTIVVDLAGNKLTKQQAMYLCKLLFHSAVVPFNAE